MIQPIGDRVTQNFEMISKTFATNQNSTHGIYDSYRVVKVVYISGLTISDHGAPRCPSVARKPGESCSSRTRTPNATGIPWDSSPSPDPTTPVYTYEYTYRVVPYICLYLESFPHSSPKPRVSLEIPPPPPTLPHLIYIWIYISSRTLYMSIHRVVPSLLPNTTDIP